MTVIVRVGRFGDKRKKLARSGFTEAAAIASKCAPSPFATNGYLQLPQSLPCSETRQKESRASLEDEDRLQSVSERIAHLKHTPMAPASVNA